MHSDTSTHLGGSLLQWLVVNSRIIHMNCVCTYQDIWLCTHEHIKRHTYKSFSCTYLQILMYVHVSMYNMYLHKNKYIYGVWRQTPTHTHTHTYTSTHTLSLSLSRSLSLSHTHTYIHTHTHTHTLQHGGVSGLQRARDFEPRNCGRHRSDFFKIRTTVSVLSIFRYSHFCSRFIL